jgi:hypothetical protein
MKSVQSQSRVHGPFCGGIRARSVEAPPGRHVSFLLKKEILIGVIEPSTFGTSCATTAETTALATPPFQLLVNKSILIPPRQKLPEISILIHQPPPPPNLGTPTLPVFHLLIGGIKVEGEEKNIVKEIQKRNRRRG